MPSSERQILIHLHSSGITGPAASKLHLGEIGVQFNTDEPKLYIKKTDGTLAQFIDSEKIDNELEKKQDTLTPGEGIDIDSGGTISAVLAENSDIDELFNN
jgi:hypothetical protein